MNNSIWLVFVFGGSAKFIGLVIVSIVYLGNIMGWFLTMTECAQTMPKRKRLVMAVLLIPVLCFFGWMFYENIINLRARSHREQMDTDSYEHTHAPEPSIQAVLDADPHFSLIIRADAVPLFPFDVGKWQDIKNWPKITSMKAISSILIASVYRRTHRSSTSALRTK